VVVDDGSGGTAEQLNQLAEDPFVRVHRIDLRDRPGIAAVCRRERPWAVVHLAGRHFIPDCQARPTEAWQVNVEGTRNLLDALAAWPPHRFLFASTAEVYRESTTPHSEDDPLGSTTVYGRSKIAAERLLEATTFRCVVIARLFNLYGPHDTVSHLIPSIITQAVTGQRLRLGDLGTARDFVYVDDAASAVVELITRGFSGTYNIGTGTAITGEHLVKRVAKLLGRSLSVTRDPRRLRPTDRRTLAADPTKVNTLLPWWPATPLDVGLESVIDAHWATQQASAIRPDHRERVR
jgi:UDP-glucose 4-epimerase